MKYYTQVKEKKGISPDLLAWSSLPWILRGTEMPMEFSWLKPQLELDMEQQTGFKSGKEYVKAVYCHSA